MTIRKFIIPQILFFLGILSMRMFEEAATMPENPWYLTIFTLLLCGVLASAISMILEKM